MSLQNIYMWLTKINPQYYINFLIKNIPTKNILLSKHIHDSKINIYPKN